MIQTRSGTADRLIAFVIFNSIPPYAYEANNILALPNGIPYRARFRREWYPDIKSPKQIENRDGIIILRDRTTARLIPLRRIRITKVKPVGDTYYFSYLLGDLVEYDSDTVVASRQVEEFNEKIRLELKPHINEPGTDLKKLVFLGPDLAASLLNSNPVEDVAQREYDNWGKIVNLLGEVESFLDIDFLKIISIDSENGKAQNLITADVTRRYLLTNNSVYILQVFQRSHTLKQGDSSVTSRKIKMQGEPDAIRPIKDNLAIVGKYDQLEFRFRTQILERNRDTDLAIDIVRSDDKGPIPTIYVPVRIETPLKALLYQFIFLVLFITGAVVLFAPDQIFSQNAQLAQRLAVLLMILTGYETRNLLNTFVDRLRLNLPNK